MRFKSKFIDPSCRRIEIVVFILAAIATAAFPHLTNVRQTGGHQRLSMNRSISKKMWGCRSGFVISVSIGGS
jgi:hypothetical protein